MQWLFLAIIAISLLFLAINAFMGANPKMLADAIRRGLGYSALLIAGILAVVGRIGLAIPIAALGFMLLSGRLSLGGAFPGRGRPTPGQHSRVRTQTLEMTLDHDTGALDGRILVGKNAGRQLSMLSLDDLLDMRTACQASDPRAVPLIEAFLDRNHDDWRPKAGAKHGESERRAGAALSGGAMTREEAYEILGLQPGAGAEAIRRAHRQLMKKLHPDQGGSNYLAAKINEAKDLLLRR